MITKKDRRKKTSDGLNNLMKHFAYRFDDLEEKMYTKKDHEVFMVWINKKMKELKDSWKR